MTKIDGNVNFVGDEWSDPHCQHCRRWSGEDRLCPECEVEEENEIKAIAAAG